MASGGPPRGNPPGFGRSTGFTPPRPTQSEFIRGINPGDLPIPPRSRSMPNPRLPNDPLGIGQLGRSDLDPWGQINPGTGMILDPRGMRQPQPQGIPPNHPTGARFDPYGPVPPAPPNFGGVPPGSGQNPDSQVPPNQRPPPPFAGPTPDHERPPPGYDDMFM